MEKVAYFPIFSVPTESGLFPSAIVNSSSVAMLKK